MPTHTKKMMKRTIVTTITLMVMTLNAYAGDLDDDIKIDEKLEQYDTLDRPAMNVQYIKRSAKASASSNSSKTFKGNGDIAIGSFINKPGAKVGDVTIIFDGEDINAINE
jgi:phosphoenolpyruvate synthase/pyruvate phosphate dikinase